MALLFWDASALAKRYFDEVGSETVDALFAHRSGHEMASTPWGYTETYSALLRKLNAGRLDAPTFDGAVANLQTEVVDDPDFQLLPIGDATIFASIPLIRRHNLNATDAAILTMLLDLVAALPTGGPTVVLIAADTRLLRGATAEGIGTLNPAILPAADVPAFLAGLT